jgi:hypothetical protein
VKEETRKFLSSIWRGIIGGTIAVVFSQSCEMRITKDSINRLELQQEQIIRINDSLKREVSKGIKYDTVYFGKFIIYDMIDTIKIDTTKLIKLRRGIK